LRPATDRAGLTESLENRYDLPQIPGSSGESRFQMPSMRHSCPSVVVAVNRHARVLLVILFAAAAIRLFLVLNLPIQFWVYAIHDDGLFMRLATHIASGHWLGEFNQFTLMKGPGYPFFLAVTNLSNLPLSAAHALFQTVAISVTAWAAFRLTGSLWIAAMMFLALIFCPIGFVFHRVYREQIYWAQTLLVLTLFATILFAPPRGRSAAMTIAGLAGAILGWAWLTREEGVWFLPGLGLMAAGAVLLMRKKRERLIAVVRNIGVAGIGFTAVYLTFVVGNLIAYGSFVGVDIKEHNFTSALDALQDVDVGPIIPYLPVSSAARSEVAKVSPTFAPLSVALDRGVSAWGSYGCKFYKQTCGDIAGGWFMWALRDAAELNGFYKNPKTAAERFGKIANEIEAACSDGRLRCHRRWVTYLPPMTGQQWASLPRTLLGAVELIALPPRLAAEAPSSFTSVISEDFDRYWTFVNNPRVETIDPSAEVTVLGWYYDSQSDQWPAFKVYGEWDQVIPFFETRQASADLQQHFSDVGAGYNRFQMRFRCPSTCTIGALNSSHPELRLALDRHRPLSVSSGSAQLYVDSVSGGAYATGIHNARDKLAADVRGGLSRLYVRLLPLLLFAGLFAAIAASWRAIRTRSLHPLLLTALAAWALVATRIVILALIEVSSFPAVNIGYSAPASYVAVVAAFLSIAAVARNASQRRKSIMSRLDELDIVIRRKNGKILARIPQFSLYAKGENVEAALAALDVKKKELAAALEETGEFDRLEIDNRRVTPSHSPPGSTFSDLSRFAIKAGVVAFCIAAALTVSGVIVGSKIEKAINNVKSVKIGGAQFWSRMEAELDRMASPVSDLPEAKKQKLLADVRAIAAKWHPFVAEIQSALASPDSPTQPPALMKDK
jgi:hypothetical protein